MSLRRTLIAGFSLLLTLVGAVAALYSYANVRNEAWGILDLQQRQIARFIGDGSGVAPNNGSLPAHEDDEDFVVQILYADGRPARMSDPQVTFPAAIVSGMSDFRDASGEWRLFTLIDGPRTVRIGQRTSERDELATSAAWNSSLPFIFAIPLSWLVVYVLVGAIMRRLEAITGEVARRSPGNLDPVDAREAPEEVRPLLAAMNGAFASLAEALKQQKLFVADAAHELRTPLAALSLQISNIEQANKDPLLVEPIQSLASGAKRATGVTSQLLRLARHEVSAAEPAASIASLDQIALRTVEALYPLAEQKEIDLGIPECRSLQVRAQDQELLTLVEVLVDNAIRYTPKGGQVDVSVLLENGQPAIVVTDSGPGIPEHLLERVFDRFFRVSEGDGLGSGLGLSIARIIADRQGARLSLANRTDRSGLIVKVLFSVENAKARKV